MKILLDHCTPLRQFLKGHEVTTAEQHGWDELGDREGQAAILLAIAATRINERKRPANVMMPAKLHRWHIRLQEVVSTDFDDQAIKPRCRSRSMTRR